MAKFKDKKGNVFTPVSAFMEDKMRKSSEYTEVKEEKTTNKNKE